ncbi:MAG: polysaccharide biosynthesis protein, partial [Acidimicrobiales bacterium]
MEQDDMDRKRSIFEPIPQRLYRRKAWALGVADIAMWSVGLLVGTFLRLGLELNGVGGIYPVLAATLLVQIIAGWLLGNYRGRYQVGSFDEVSSIVGTWAVAGSVAASANYAVFGRPVPTTGLISGAFLALAGMGAARLLWRVYLNRMSRVDPSGRKRILVFGAGEGGRQILRAMQSDPKSEYLAVGILDDEPVKAHRVIEGVPVVGTRHDILAKADSLKAGLLLIAIPSADGEVVSELANIGRSSGLEVMVLPDTSSLMGSFAMEDDIQPIEEVDLLGRAEVEVDLLAISDYIAGKRVLVTGAGGSIGSELCRQLGQFEPARLMMLDRDESALHGVQLSIEGHGLLDSDDLIVADIRDRERL